MPRAWCATIPCSSGKRRRLAPDETETWASLPPDLLELIGWRVLAGDLLDYVRFRAVCAHWSSSTVRPRGRGLVDPRFHPRRWMMLPEGHGLYPGHPNLAGHVRFVNLSTGAFARVHLPLFDDHVVLDSVDGLLLLLRHRDLDTAVRLLHPFTGDIAELPPLLSLLPQLEPRARNSCAAGDTKLREIGIFLRGICAAAAVSATGAVTVMLALEKIEIHRVAYATAGDKRWTVAPWTLPPLLTPMASSQGKLYLYATSPQSATYQDDCKVYIHRIDPPQPNAELSLSLSPPVMIAECPLLETAGKVSLVECGSELLFVGFSDDSFAHLSVYRLTDLVNGRVVPIKNIGDHALFLDERGLCLSPNKWLPSAFGNSITCVNRSGLHDPQVETHGLRVEQFHLSSGTWSLAMDGDIFCSDRPPASPYMLAHHIFTCCCPSYWNKGLMLNTAIMPDWSVKPNLQNWTLADGWSDSHGTSDIFPKLVHT
ncbi:hypothetical protein ACP70R_025422 [Stipagrostis hirtigluma subsp. patula]